MLHCGRRLDRVALKASRSSLRAFATACGVLLALAMPAHAAVMPGDHFTFNWLATVGPNAGASGTASVIIGAAQVSPFFGVASFDATAAGFCGVCSPLTEDLSAVQFDSSTFGLVGDITGTFLGQGGGLHSFDLTLTDVVGSTGTFTFANTIVGDGTIVDSGTYTPLVAVADGPSAIVLLALGSAGIAASRRRKQSR